MIIPIRCFTCGKLIGHLWEDYQKRLQEKKNEVLNVNGMSYILTNVDNSTIENDTLNDMGIKRICCRRMLISHVDLCEKI